MVGLTCRRAVMFLAHVLSFVLAANATSAQEDCGGHWFPELNTLQVGLDYHSILLPWDPDGPGPRPEVLVAGFTSGYFGSVAQWDGTRWLPFPDDPWPASTRTRSLATWSGRLVAADYWTIASWDGLQWQVLASNAGDVMTMLEFRGELVAAGTFKSIDGIPMTGVARFDGTSWREMSEGISGTVMDLAVHGENLVAVGSFTSATVPVSNVAIWDGLQWQAMGAGVNGTVRTVAATEHELYIGGDFTKSGELTVERLARWESTSQLWVPVGGGMKKPVQDLVPDHGKLYVLGDHLEVAGEPTLGAAIWEEESDTWIPLSRGDFSSAASPILHAGALFRGELVASAMFDSLNGDFVPVRWNQRWHALENSRFTVRDILGDGGGVYVVGTGKCLDTNSSGVERWTPSHHGCFDFVALGSPGVVGRIVLWNGQPTVLEYSSGGSPVYVRTFDPESGSWVKLGPAKSSQALEVFRGDLVMQRDGRLQIWDGSAWQPWSPMVSGTIWCLLSRVDDIVAGGFFGLSSSGTYARVARFDGSAWTPMSFPPGTPTGTVYALAEYQGQVFAGGSFAFPDGLVKNLARWSGTQWEPVGGLVDGPVYALTVYNGTLIVGGLFTHAGDLETRNIARWDGNSWSALGTGVNGQVSALTVAGDELNVGGEFWEAGGYDISHWARWTDHLTPKFTDQPASVVTTLGRRVRLDAAVTPGFESIEPVQFTWSHDGVLVADGPGGASLGGGMVDGARTANLRIAGVQESDLGKYICSATSACGSASSNAATIGLYCPADLDHSGAVDTDDFTSFVALFEEGTESADFDGSGFVDTEDFDAFVRAFEFGC